MNDNSKNSKKWCVTTIVTIILAIMLVGVINIVIDPYFHFHKPIFPYRLYEERYINDGIARHFDYDSIIIGNSLCQNFKISEYDELFSGNAVKLPYSGAGYYELWSAIDRAAIYNKDLKKVLIGADLEDMSKGPFWIRYNELPEYLYDDNIFNDIYYVLNKEILYRGSLYSLAMYISGKPSTSFDEYSSWDRPTGPQRALDGIQSVRKDDSVPKRQVCDYDLNEQDGNLELNVFPVIEANPDVEFVLFIPPNSIAKWLKYYNNNEIDWRVDMLMIALERLLAYENVSIYAFDDAFEVTTNLDLYSDSIHYEASVNSWILEEISKNNHKISIDNYMDYIENIRGFYSSYDYKALEAYLNK